MARITFNQWVDKLIRRQRGTRVNRHPRRTLTFEQLNERITPTVNAFSLGGVLTVVGDNADNAIEVSRDAAGNLEVNGGAVRIYGGTRTVANTSRIQIFGFGGDDRLALNETNGALPSANLYGGSGNDTLIGGSAADFLFGQLGNDTLLGKGGIDFLFGGAGNDILTGGSGNDQVFGGAGDDRMILEPRRWQRPQRGGRRHRHRRGQRRQWRRELQRHPERQSRPLRPHRPGPLLHRHRHLRKPGPQRQRRRRFVHRLQRSGTVDRTLC